MKKITLYCDCCGKQIETGHFRGATIKLHIDEWSGGSMGGSEDWFDYEAEELCEDCAHELQTFVTKMGLKRKVRKY